MHLFWIAPAAVTVAGAAALAATAARTASELRALRREVARFAELRPAVVELRRVGAEAGTALAALRRG